MYVIFYRIITLSGADYNSDYAKYKNNQLQHLR